MRKMNKIEKLQSKTRKIDKEFWQKLEKKLLHYFATYVDESKNLDKRMWFFHFDNMKLPFKNCICHFKIRFRKNSI